MSVITLVFAQLAPAAGMDCSKAASAVENTICAQKPLYELDVQMGTAYQTLMSVVAEERSELKKAQRQWLKTRTECADDVGCLEQSYRDRLQALRAQWIATITFQPDDLDKQVMEDLRQRVMDLRKSNPEFALERALGTLAYSQNESGFFAELDSDEHPLFPKAMPKGVTQDEWNALIASNITGAAESGETNYTLMDLNGDGQRDLIVETYSGGTGMFHFTETYRRVHNRFIKTAREPESSTDSSLFYTNDRGANQSATWIKARAKVYLAYRNSFYGVDTVYLLDPLKINNLVPTMMVHYDYQLTVPRTQYIEEGNKTYKLEPGLHTALTKALINVNSPAPEVASQGRAPICPIPSSAKDNESYYGFGAGYYVEEPVADIAVTIGKDCFVARLINWYGRYDEKSGLPALLMLRKPDSEDPERSYSVNGRRHITQISTSIGKAENGAESN
ncbi:lysozyme inhibitor LprI family protein [Pseudomonas botevensis]|uniref:lysozyme inhibitor LprI family protein n=1 Tax=Pseudomonas botevensis TaxID=2842352 RepID=UPI00298FC399|nr:lysozyme inhibitor LprI family protein [Pseudomonas botevensis]